MNDIGIIRQLARDFLEIIHDSHNAECLQLHKAVNDLYMIRPVVMINELPWPQLNFNGELNCYCENEDLRRVEHYMRYQMFRFKYFRGDMIVRPYIPIPKLFSSTGMGLSIEEETIQSSNSFVKSHEYVDQLSTEEDLEKLHNEIITYDEEETNRRYNVVGEVIGDLLPIRKTGINHISLNPWDDIASLRGVTNVLMDLIDDEELSHKMAKKMFDIVMDRNDQYIKLGLIDTDPDHLHQTAVATDDLPPIQNDTMKYENIWGRAACQVFSSVSKEMRDEFDIRYMKDTIGKCGLVYYGCCEPLDTMIDVVEKIPHLRKITMTPWANVDVGAEAIGKKYVMACKPNPASVSQGAIDKETLSAEFDRILAAGKRNNCSFELTLKDISTCGNNPQAIMDWEKMAMEKVRNF